METVCLRTEHLFCKEKFMDKDNLEAVELVERMLVLKLLKDTTGNGEA